MIKNHWMKKLKYLSLFFLLFAIYWFPDVILAYPEVYLKSLVGYERQVVATWIFLGNMSISLFLGILFVIYFFSYTYYNSHFITPGIAKTQAAFSIQIVFPFVQFITIAICAPIFEEAAFRTTIYRFFKNDKIAYIVSCVGFAWMHTGPNPILIVYLPMSIVLTSIYHRRRVLGESILVHGVFNALLPIVIPLLQVITGLYYL